MAKIGHIGLLVKLFTHTMPYQVANHAKAVFLNISLYGVSDGTDTVTNFDGIDTSIKCLFRHLDKLSCFLILGLPFFLRQLSQYWKSNRHISIEVSVDNTKIKTQYIPFLKHAFGRHAMHYFVIYRRAEYRWKSPIAKK